MSESRRARALARLSAEYDLSPSEITRRLEASRSERTVRVTESDTMSTSTNQSETVELLQNHRLSELWDPQSLERLAETAESEAERDILEALLEYQEQMDAEWARIGFDDIDVGLSGKGYDALASKVEEVREGGLDTLGLKRNGSTSAESEWLANAEAADRHLAAKKLEKADALANRGGMPERVDTLREEAASHLGVESHDEIDVDALSEQVERDAFLEDDTEDEDDGEEAYGHLNEVDTAREKLRKAESFRANDAPERADTLEAEAREHLAAADVTAEELTAAGYDTLARFLGSDPDAKAAEIDDFETARERIDILEGKAQSFRSRGLEERADEIEAELDALRDRAEDLAR